ncbi:MAG: restriction endonuclease, partial [Pseudomonadota bacterium]
MSDGSISDYFTGVAAKRLAAVDAEPESSNQHEVTGSSPLRKILGDVDRKLASNNGYKTTFIWVAQENESVLETGFVSWYDSRRQNKRRSEWRLYYQGNAVTKLMQAGDFLFLARQPNGELLFVIVPRDSELAAGMFWLFNLEKPVEEKFVARRP